MEIHFEDLNSTEICQFLHPLSSNNEGDVAWKLPGNVLIIEPPGLVLKVVMIKRKKINQLL